MLPAAEFRNRLFTAGGSVVFPSVMLSEVRRSIATEDESGVPNAHGFHVSGWESKRPVGGVLRHAASGNFGQKPLPRILQLWSTGLRPGTGEFLGRTP